jgi:hypothetical protein
VFDAARQLLLVVAAFVLLWVAVATIFVPARNALAATFGLALPREDGSVAFPPEDRLRGTFAPLVVPFIVLVVVGLASLLRGG